MIDSFIIASPFCVVIIIFQLLGINIPFFAHHEITHQSNFISYISSSTIMVTYYTISEYYFNGKTIGKFITNTRAVTLDNQTMDFDLVLKRSLCRVIPFEIASFLSNSPSGWHDQWSDTKVILDELKEEEEEEFS